MRGLCFCVSYAEPRDADWCLEHAQSLMLDNGAFSIHQAVKAGKRTAPLDPDAFATWAARYIGGANWAVAPDVIDGTVEQQREMLARWPHPRHLSAAVWHMGLPIDWLLELASEWPRICFGSTKRYWRVGSPEWEGRCFEAWAALDKRGLRPWVHMLRGMKLAGECWPFASVDSVNVARNFKRNGVCPADMARRIDTRQSPVHWPPDIFR
jgi:hypothetical protein